MSRVLAQCIHDVQAANHHHTPIYNLDFSIVASCLFPDASPASKSFLPDTREIGAWILERHDNTEPYILAVSGAMYYEFLDQIHHRVAGVSYHLPRYDSANFEHIVQRELLQPSAQLIDNLMVLTNRGRDELIRKPAERLLELLRAKKVQGLGDFLHMPEKADLESIKVEFDKIVKTQMDYRLLGDRKAGRSDTDSLFHYKMDAINICLSRFFSKDLHSRTLFVTPSLPNLKSCEIDHDLVGRHMLVPLFLKNAHILEQSKYLSNKLEWLIEAFEMCERLKKKLEPYLAVDDARLVPPVILNQLNSFYTEYHGLLTRTRHVDPLDMRHEAQEELSAILSSRQTYRDRIEETLSEAQEMAHKISEHEPVFGVSYLDEFDLESDPILKKITKELLK